MSPDDRGLSKIQIALNHLWTGASDGSDAPEVRKKFANTRRVSQVKKMQLE